MFESDLPPYSIQDLSLFIDVTVLIDNATINLGVLTRPLRFEDIVKKLIQLGKCTRKIDGLRL
jgi:hypothetical protein